MRCTHCGLPVPAGLVIADAAEQFCCNGCKTVYQMIRGCGLEQYYRLRESAAADATPARTTDRAYGEFDDATFGDLHVQTLPDGTQATELYLESVHCAACVWLVEKLPRVVPGVIEARLDFRQSLVRIRWDAARVKLSRIARSLDTLGYPPHPAKDARARDLRTREDRRFLILIGVAAACVGNVMTLAFALYGGWFSGIESEYETLFRWVSMLIGAVCLAWPGSVFFRGAFAAFRTRTAHLDLPIALALLVGGVAGTFNAITGRGEIYFDSLTMLVFLLLVGRWFQRRQQRYATDSVEMLFSLTPSSARVVDADGARDVPIEAVRADDLVEVRAGESIPVDGAIEEGASWIDQSLLTGESQPVEVHAGRLVHAGTVNTASTLRVRVSATGARTRVGRLAALVEQSSQSRAPVVQFADRVGAWFVPAALALATATFAVWAVSDTAGAVEHAVAMLIVTCPCALGLATPLIFTIAIGRAARRGILIKGGAVLETLARRGTIVLDKTGTVTSGEITLVRWAGDKEVKPAVAAIEAQSNHPIARAFVRALAPTTEAAIVWRAPADRLAQPGDTPAQIEEHAIRVEQTSGAGVVAEVEGEEVRIGSPAFVRAAGAYMPQELEREELAIIAAALTPVLIARNGRVVAIAGLGDTLRPDARAAIDELTRLGWKIGLLSGDHPAIVLAIGRQLGIDENASRGGVMPEEKLAHVQAACRRGRVVMVGDGVNDAAALAAADVGIAVHGGAEAALAAADIYLSRPGLAPLAAMVRSARRVLGAIHVTLIVSLGYNVLAAALALAGLINPIVAAILMPLSSLTVLSIAIGRRTFVEEHA